MLSVLLAVALAATPSVPEGSLIDAGGPVAVRLQAEVGALAQLRHELQIGEQGTYVRIPSQLGQDVLAPFLRFQIDLDIGRDRRNTLAFLYQPLDLRSRVAPESDLAVGDLTFPAGRALDFRYGFSFWRATWLYDVLKRQDAEVALGLGLQIRNANIVYAALDGSQAVNTTDIGPVPLLAFRGRGTVTRAFWMAGEVQGFWAPIQGLNGSTSRVEGAIADASLKFGLAGPKGADAFLALRYIGGGAIGASNNPAPFTDGFTRNWLHFLALSVGFGLR